VSYVTIIIIIYNSSNLYYIRSVFKAEQKRHSRYIFCSNFSCNVHLRSFIKQAKGVYGISRRVFNNSFQYVLRRDRDSDVRDLMPAGHLSDPKDTRVCVFLRKYNTTSDPHLFENCREKTVFCATNRTICFPIFKYLVENCAGR